jgi:hypothetical protein
VPSAILLPEQKKKRNKSMIESCRQQASLTSKMEVSGAYHISSHGTAASMGVQCGEGQGVGQWLALRWGQRAAHSAGDEQVVSSSSPCVRREVGWSRRRTSRDREREAAAGGGRAGWDLGARVRIFIFCTWASDTMWASFGPCGNPPTGGTGTGRQGTFPTSPDGDEI